MKFYCYTLGCKVNQYETQAMEQLLTALGAEAGSENDFDLCIVNTCTVTAVADRKNRSVIRRLRREHPEAVLGVCGCYAQMEPSQIAALGVDVVSGSTGREDFVQRLLQTWRERSGEPTIVVDEALRRRDFERLPAGGLAARTRAMLKVQDGCTNFCSYCIIPYARGPVRSLPAEEAVAQAAQLAAEGYLEIVVTGIEVASWGQELPGRPRFDSLIAAVCAAAPGVRIRLGSLEPRVIDHEFCQVLSRFGNFCPQFHLSLQSGSDTVLRRMRRKYDTARYMESVSLLREYFPGCALTTDLIVGFPGETDEEFAQSLDFARRVGFAAMHVFPYSRRPGTPAAAMPSQLSAAQKAERAAAACAVANELRARFNRALLGTVQQVLFEQPEGDCFTGHAPCGVKVYAPGEALHNRLCDVHITALRPDGVLGTLVAPDEP